MSTKNFKMAQFESALSDGTATWWQMYLPSGGVIFGEAKTKMLDYDENMFKHYMDFVNIVHPDDREKTMEAMKDYLAGKAKVYEAVYRIKAANGEYIKFYDCGQITEKNGDNLTVTGFVLKVSDEVDIFKQMENFKDLILNGNPSIIELVSRIR